MQAIGYKDGQPTGLALEKDVIDQADADAYRGSIDYLLVDGVTQIAPSPLPEAPTQDPAPLTDVEMGAGKMAQRRLVREELIFSPTSGLVGTCYAWLQRPCAVPGEEAPQSLSPSAALAAGQGLCSTYGNQLRSWVDWATADFYTSMSSPDPTRPWLEWTPAGESKSIREAILDRVYLATFGTPRP